jgi:hypothetical protein
MELDLRCVLVVRGERASKCNAKRGSTRQQQGTDRKRCAPREGARRRHVVSGDAVTWERTARRRPVSARSPRSRSVTVIASTPGEWHRICLARSTGKGLSCSAFKTVCPRWPVDTLCPQCPIIFTLAGREQPRSSRLRLSPGAWPRAIRSRVRSQQRRLPRRNCNRRRSPRRVFRIPFRGRHNLGYRHRVSYVGSM